MNAITPTSQTAQARAIVVDINHELRWWREHYAQYPVGRPSYGQAEPTLKFAYDTYLLHPHAHLDALWPDIRRRYAQLPLHQQLDWTRAGQVIGEVWRRILTG